MKRTQIYLDETMLDLLRQQSRAEKKTISEIIRQAMEAHLQANESRIHNQVDRVSGIRGDQNGNVHEYIRSLRKDREI
jgi:hypothetical protein